MSINITESDRLAYDCSAAQNSRLTLEEFTKNRRQEKIQNAQASQRYEERLKLTKRSLLDSIGKLKWTKDTCVQRTIVIDGASVLESDTSISSLLSVARFFVSRKFEALLVLPKSFQKFHEVSELAKTDICVFVPQTGQMALQVAAQINGVIVTWNPLEGSCEDFNLRIEWRFGKIGHRRTETFDYIPGKQFFFKNGYGEEMFEDEVISKVYTFPIQLQYGISKERRDMAYSDEKKDKILALLNQLIVDGLTKKTVVMPEQSPRKSPVQSPRDQDEQEEDEW